MIVVICGFCYYAMFIGLTALLPYFPEDATATVQLIQNVPNHPTSKKYFEK